MGKIVLLQPSTEPRYIPIERAEEYKEKAEILSEIIDELPLEYRQAHLLINAITELIDTMESTAFTQGFASGQEYYNYSLDGVEKTETP